jgi:GT2 family glycosyltransferase
MNQSFTFAICTDFKNISSLNQIINSIVNQTVKDIEILIIGDTVNINSLLIDTPLLKIYDFDSKNTWPPGREYLKGKNTFWIAEKKNKLIEESKNNIMIMLHDYYMFLPNFCENFKTIEHDWDFCMPHVVTVDGKNSSHWVSWDHPTIPRTFTMPYSLELSKYAYVPGSFWVAKTEVMKKEKISENLVWCEDRMQDNYSSMNEDVEFSLRIRSKGYRYIYNLNSVAVCLKHGKYGIGPWA